MKRIIFLLIASLIILPSLRAQESDFNGWGIRAALDVNMPSKWKTSNGDKIKMFSSGVGFTVGGVYNRPFAGNFYVEPGVSLFYDTYKFSDLTIGIDDNGTPQVIDPKVKKFGVRVPLTVGYRFFVGNDFNFTLYTGPEFSYAFTGKIGVDKEVSEAGAIPTDLFDFGYRRADCAWKVGVGFPAGRWVVALEGAFGITDLHKNDVKFHENRLSLSVGYDF